jgi:hypothetical protein
LLFGISSAPERTMETLLQGIPNASVYLHDNIFITEKDGDEHLIYLHDIIFITEKDGDEHLIGEGRDIYSRVH